MTAGSVLEAFARVKSGGGGFLTNFYATPDIVDRWATRGSLRLLELEGAVLLLRRDQDFDHLSYAATDLPRLTEALRAPALAGDTLTADLIGRESDLGRVVGAFETAEFHRHTSLVRLTRMADPAFPDDYSDSQVVSGRREDGPAVQAFLARLLDRFAEQLPEVDEIEAAAERGNLLLERRGADLGGVLLFEATGQTAVLRYWFVNDRFRDQGIGARLIKTFFRTCRSSRRIVLWVIADNHDSIAKYGHYRFRPEGLVDHVMIRKGERLA
ncbi:MAG: GNAT family N-acetyltransferase [Anaeromyxobacteraceae bacterium]